MGSLSPRAYLALLWTATCVALAGLGQLTAGLVATAGQPSAGPARTAAVDLLSPFTVDGSPAAAPAPAARPAAGPAPAPAPLAEVASKALAEITYPWPRLGYRIEFAAGRPGLRGETIPAQHRIVIFVTAGEPEAFITHVIAHEIGHAVDFTYNDGDRRAQWLRMRGIGAATPWFGCSGCADFATPAGDFAETFAYWQVGDADYSRMAAGPDRAQLRSLEPLFWPSAPQAQPSPPPPPTQQPDTAPAGGSAPSLLCVDAICTG